MESEADSLPKLETPRLILQAVTHEDIPFYEKHFIDYEVIRHLAAVVPWPYPKNGVREFLDNFVFPLQGKDLWLWGIFERQNPVELIGVIHLWRNGKPEHRGFWLARKHWGKGYMTEAAEAVTEYAFTTLGFEKLVFANAVGNIRSRRIKEKAGCKFIGVEPAKFVDPALTEHELWELSKADWIKTRAN